MSWNNDRVATLKQLWADGFSASQVAARLGGFEHCPDGGRSAVIGKVWRLGLPRRDTTNRIKSSRRIGKHQLHQWHKRKAKPKGKGKPFVFATAPNMVRSPPMEPAPLPVVEELVIPLKERKYIQTLEDADCRWPIGDPRQPDFHFCGKEKVPGLPYCGVHVLRAFQPPKPRQLPDNVIMLPVKQVVAA